MQQRKTRFHCLWTAALCVALLSGCGGSSGDKPDGDKPEAEKKTLRLLAGAGLRRAVDELIVAFEKESGVLVEPDYGGSGMILARAQQDTEADLFMPGDVWYVEELHKRAGLIESQATVSYFVPVMIVAKGNPKGITGLADLFKPGVKPALGRADACQVGQLTTKILEKNGLDRSKLDPKESLTVNELGVWVQMGDVDVAIVWDAIAANITKDVDLIEIPKEKNLISNVVVGLMTTSQDKASAQAFIDFMTGEKGQAILTAKGYRTNAP